MKQGLKFQLPVEFGIDLDTVESIRFKFMQHGGVMKTFSYPSSVAVRDGTTDVVDLIWDHADTYKFRVNEPIVMDTFVTLTDSEYNPETAVVTMMFTPTLFTKAEVTA